MPVGIFNQGKKDVSINGFEIAKYEVTNKQYAVFLNGIKISADGLFKGMQLIDVSSADLQLHRSL